MNRFLCGHATHPDPSMALALAAAQVEAQRGAPGSVAHPTLGWLYVTEDYVAHLADLVVELAQRWPGVEWVGASGVGIAASGVEYFDEPALSLMLCDLPRDHFRVFNGARPLGRFAAHTAQVHADPATPDLPELIADMSARTATGYLFGGLTSGQRQALHLAGSALSGGLSGVAFDAAVPVLSRVTQGCQPIGPTRRVTSAHEHLILGLDGEPALDCLLRDLGLEGASPREAMPALRRTLVGVDDADAITRVAVSPREGTATRSAFDQVARRGSFGADTLVRHLIGLDTAGRGIAIGASVAVGLPVSFCTRDTRAAARDLTRICAELREEIEPQDLALSAAQAAAAARAPGGDPESGMASAIAGAVYVTCAGRGGPHFGSPSAELALVQRALGDVPLVGFFAAGEIARRHLYGYTGVLTLFPR